MNNKSWRELNLKNEISIRNLIQFYPLNFLPHAGRHHYCSAANFSSFEKIMLRIFSNSP
jgi:hypothetical protein